MNTTKEITPSVFASASASEIIRQIALAEKQYQEELNRGFGSLSEGAFKNLRRQLPVTRQKVRLVREGYSVMVHLLTRIPIGRLGQDQWIPVRPRLGWWKVKIVELGQPSAIAFPFPIKSKGMCS